MRAVARRIGANEGNFPGKVARGLTADLVIEIARAYKLNVIQALVDTGHINPEEAPEVLSSQIESAFEEIRRIAERVKQSDYSLVADSSPEEGDGNPDNYEP